MLTSMCICRTTCNQTQKLAILRVWYPVLFNMFMTSSPHADKRHKISLILRWWPPRLMQSLKRSWTRGSWRDLELWSSTKKWALKWRLLMNFCSCHSNVDIQIVQSWHAMLFIAFYSYFLLYHTCSATLIFSVLISVLTIFSPFLFICLFT